MKQILTTMLALLITAPLHTIAQPDQARLIHFSLINMSGSSREAHLHEGVVELPVARKLPVEALAGAEILVTSRTNHKVETLIAISPADEGRTIPVN